MSTREEEIIEERRITTLEINQLDTDEILVVVKKDIADIKKDVQEIKTTIAKAGGILLGFTMIGAFFGYVLTQLDKLKHFLVGN